MIDSTTPAPACTRSAAPDRHPPKGAGQTARPPFPLLRPPRAAGSPPAEGGRATSPPPLRRAAPGIHGPRTCERAGRGTDHLTAMSVAGRRRSRAVAVLVAGIIAATVAGAADLGRLLPGLEQESVVQRYEHRATRPAPNLPGVAVDDKTFADTGYHWPFQRRRHARAIDRLRRAGARVIVYDVQLTEQTTPRAH